MINRKEEFKAAKEALKPLKVGDVIYRQGGLGRIRSIVSDVALIEDCKGRVSQYLLSELAKAGPSEQATYYKACQNQSRHELRKRALRKGR